MRIESLARARSRCRATIRRLTRGLFALADAALRSRARPPPVVERRPPPHARHALVLPSVLAERPLRAHEFISKKDRRALAAALDALLASPTFSAWREGASLDVGEWMTPKDGRTPCVIVSVAHLDDEERALVLGIVLEETSAWVRSLSGSAPLRALVIFDEVYGFLPPHPANPPTKRPLVTMMKQARAFGVGVVVATQNPMDLDYRALGNAGVWCVGRLQTDADRARVVEGMASSQAPRSVGTASTDAIQRHTRDSREVVRELDDTVKRLGPRWFIVRDAHATDGPVLLNPRWAMSWLRGPMTRVELERAMAQDAPLAKQPSAAE